MNIQLDFFKDIDLMLHYTMQKHLYVSKDYIEKSEVEFRSLLEQVITPKDYYVESQLSLLRFIKDVAFVKKPHTNLYFPPELLRFVDFSVVKRNERKVTFCIEYNGNSHDEVDKHIKDLKLKNILESADIPLIVFPRRDNWTVEQIREELNNNEKLRKIIY
ncbi:MAG: DUF2726 domain-containing protein [Clostridiales bacterium]|jgi:hypothetical protein|nr:DUF2726 domain-containing protein [Clostridiales bacterium]